MSKVMLKFKEAVLINGFIAWKPSLRKALNNASSEATIVGFIDDRFKKTAS